ncbi:MAG: CMP-N,N-diacetyllegionaminic acid synthase [Thermoleophilaceae bacterium]|nr:CMP-N,N-diacetyllegionaminic acid synthase [Thermoleophilaceae bacterium]
MAGAVALVPARAGSTRVPGKNIKPLAGHPLIAYSIAGALDCGLFGAVVVSTDSEEIAQLARSYGAEAAWLRPSELAGATSPDIEWVAHALGQPGMESWDMFAILRPTSPFRSAAAIRRAHALLEQNPDADSVRAVRRCREHPGKMWTLDGHGPMRPLLDQPEGQVPLHSRQYAALPEVYVQDSSLEIARSRAVLEQNSISGAVILPLLSEGHEGFSIDYPDDWDRAEALAESGEAVLPALPART